MNILPNAPNLPIEHLAGAFRNTTNSYKYYWFLAILNHIKAGGDATISIDALLADMVTSVWYPVNYFHLSFGSQDKLGRAVLTVKVAEDIDANDKPQAVQLAVSAYLNQNGAEAKKVRQLTRYVPTRFLRPWFQTETKGMKDHKVDNYIAEAASDYFTARTTPMYCFVEPNSIKLNPHWLAYLRQHLNILQGFCWWHLLNYLQKRNPNVPNIASKLFPPETRDLRNAHRFWQEVIQKRGAVACIYSSETMTTLTGNSIEHFLPWSFVAHDLNWNLVPTPKPVNSAKRDRLPEMSRYFEPFADLQYEAVQVVTKAKLLEDYVLMAAVGSVAELKAMPRADFTDKLHDTIAPQIVIARNMGFTSNWVY
ncbi:MAG TPA: HNH endonuclease domain-containing protein [Anaerolineae bacterium]|nr:HNH endonuclease domain-containing protein [Anaerolineae bacterium]